MKPIVISGTFLITLALVLGYKAFTQTINIAGKFQSEKITLTFRSNLKQVVSTKGDVLELATLESDEFFRRSNEREVLGIYLGTTVAEIMARSTFRYHLLLSDDWNLNVRSNVCLVRAPRFRPTLPVAIQTDKMAKYAASGWARFDKQDQLNDLESSMTPELAQRASDPQHYEAVREKCRQSVAAFVKNWLLREDHWRKDRFSALVVEFADETESLRSSERSVPILRLED